MTQQKVICIFISLLTYLNIFTTQTHAEQNTTLKTIQKINIKTTLILTSPIKKNKSLTIKSLIIPELALYVKNAKIKILNDGYKITTGEGTLKTKQIENILKSEGIIKEFPEGLNGTIQWTNATIIKNTNGIEIQINNTEIKNSKLINNLKNRKH